MAHRLNISRMKLRLQFGDYKKTEEINENTGETIKNAEFKTEYTLWGAEWSVSQARSISLAGQEIKNAREFAIRHNDKITSDLKILYKGDVYIIDSISYDDSGTPKDYDIITCHKEDKHG